MKLYFIRDASDYNFDLFVSATDPTHALSVWMDALKKEFGHVWDFDPDAYQPDPYAIEVPKPQPTPGAFPWADLIHHGG